MLRDFKFLRRNAKTNEETENVPVNPRDSLASQSSTDSTRPPLNTIQDPAPNPNPRHDKTPNKPKVRNFEPLRTPDKVSKYRFGWAQRNESGGSSVISNESRDEVRTDFRDLSKGGGGFGASGPNVTPRGNKRANSESNSTQSTPSKSVVSKPPVSSGFRGKGGSFSALYRGLPVSGGLGGTTVVNSVEVPHFDLKEDPSFWMEHNVQVLIRVRPLNSMERSMHGYNRCLKQESAQSITWIGQPETRFTFDHVACETVDQEMLFRMAGLPMVENCLSGYNSCMFAYGQTGSGKTYTMLGEIDGLEVKPSPNRGMTPRIFEFLFARIQAEEESRKDERLKYNCKCSFLEIYNEQITDLLDPSSTNLLLREDVKKGVYVENLSEFEVQTVSDILKLLTQGSLNRKVAATNMNRESSRSHSVFTCVIESRWEKDSATNLRFARLNLVDLAGSERQKSSGAEGERLKEAANINKSLSTLGHVIMILLDVVHGRARHVPYRDSRLTFLLQDSLGGNSKTMIIANVSPSICLALYSCAAETLNTLKFAQRAKLIQNNAVVNEDSSGDVIALQHQIRLLKEELSFLKRQNVSRSLSFGSTGKDTMQEQDTASTEIMYDMDQQHADDLRGVGGKGIVRMSTKQLKSLETTLAGALRREQMAETSIKKLEAEIEQLNRLVRQREEDTRSSKMMLRFREDKIQRMESLVGGLLPPDTYLLEENQALSEEIQLIQAKVDKNPEVTRFALENIRLLDQLRRFQEFYEEGEREILLEEVSKLREQLLQFLDGKFMMQNLPNANGQPQEAMRTNKENDSLHLELKNTFNELDECRRNLNSCLEENQKLSREINDLQYMLDNLKSVTHDQDGDIKTLKNFSGAPTSETVMLDGVQCKLESMEAAPEMMKHAEDILDLQLELDILKIILKEERSSHEEIKERSMCLTGDLELAKVQLNFVTKQFEDATCELKEVKLVVEALESQQILAINEMEDLRKSKIHYAKLLSEKELQMMVLKEQISEKELRDLPSKHSGGDDSNLQKKLKRMQDSLEKAKRLNVLYQNDHAFQASNEEEMDEVRQQAEAETAEVIVCMQEELSILQNQVHDCHLKEMETKNMVMLLETELKELREKLYVLTEENRGLNEMLEGKEGELKNLSEEWEFLACEVEAILADGQEAIMDAADQVDLISSSFPEKRIWISEQVGRLIRTISEKELLIEELGKCLEDANDKQNDVECMLNALRGAALVMNEANQQECNEKEEEILFLNSQLAAKTSTIAELENKVKVAELHASKASDCATVAFVVVNRLSEVNLNNLHELAYKNVQLSESAAISQRKEALLNDQATAIKEAEEQIQFLKMEVAELKETCAQLQQRLSEEEKHACAMEEKLEEIEESDILNTREKLAELKTGVSSIRSCMATHGKHDRSPEMNERQRDGTINNGGSGWTDAGEGLRIDVSESSSTIGKRSLGTSCGRKDEGLRTPKDVTISLLKGEIEFALESLKEVKREMAKLHAEKEEIWMSEKHSQESMKCFTTQILALQEVFSNFETQFETKIQTVNDKLQAFEQIIQEAGICWCQTKEFLEMEVGDAKIVAAQKMAEASCIYAKFEEAQDTMKEADIMINELMIANEAMKLDMERMKQIEVKLTSERDMLDNEVQSLQSLNGLKDQQFEDLEMQFGLDLMETKDLVVQLEGVISQVQISFEIFLSMLCEFHSLKALVLDSGKLVRSWLEDVWSEIIVKDSAVSVLHLCHMGILLETVTGLNAENGLLQHGLSESDSLITDLRERNSKTSRELQTCRTLKGKLLADIKNSFVRILRKEEETERFGLKLTSFEKKIYDIQLQEELMLQRSNYMGSQLAVLMKEMDSTNTNAVESLFNQEKMLEEEKELRNSQTELFMMDLCSKDIESFILASQLEEMCLREVAAEREHLNCCSILEDLKNEIIFSKIDTELKGHLFVAKEADVALLQRKVKEANREVQDLLSSLKDVACSNDKLRSELGEVMTTRMRLLSQIQELEAECDKLQKNLKSKESDLEKSSSQIDVISQQKQELQKSICQLETASSELQTELELKDLELRRLNWLEEENKSLKDEVSNLKTEKSLVLQDLEKKKSEVESSLSQVDMENDRLQDKILSLESVIVGLQTDLEMKSAEVNELQNSQSVAKADMCLKNQDLQSFVCKLNAMKDENILLRSEIRSHKKVLHEVLTKSALNTAKYVASVESVRSISHKLFNGMEKESYVLAEKMFHEFCENIEGMSEFIKEIECLESCTADLVSDNMSLQAELLRKDDILKGLSFDLSLLQESASNTKDQKDKLKELMASMEALEDELVVKSSELEQTVAHSQLLEAQLMEKIDAVSNLESDIAKGNLSLESLSCENLDLRAQIQETLAAKCSLEEELTEKRSLTESLETELSQMGDALGEMSDTIESLRSHLSELTSERDQLQLKMHSLEDKLQRTEAWAEETEAIAEEAQQTAESRKIYAEEKEAEVKLLERSVEELECTINVLENKVDILKGEAERQRLQREELEDELHSVKYQMQNVENVDTGIKRHLEEKERGLEEALKHIQILESSVSDKDAEISQFKAHVTELNLHAEAHASEYKQKFKALEAMVEQVKPEGHISHSTSSSSNKSEKNAAKSRGSSSPFKCIGLGLAQQIKSEKDEDLASARLRIEELESLAVNRQKEIFALNARLAAAESMTHDVIRDLLGVKLDMTNYVSLLDDKQVQKIAEKAQLGTFEPHVKDQEIIKLKQQLNGFIEERRGWLEEIDCKHAELVAAQVALEKLHQRDQLLKTESEMLKMENVNHKKKVMELEGEEENNSLKIHNEDLSAKLRRAEINLSRIKEELAHHRASVGKSPYIDFEGEQRLMNKLKEIEDDKVQLAQKLLGLCTSILKAAGITKPVSSITPSVAEDALEQLKNRITSLERELQDLTVKTKITNERIRLSELRPQTSPINSRTDDNRQTPRRGQVPFFSALDR
ncbi:hypothetical protein POTOM_017615 [Populus tomentosa]|uniref:Kinesin motor domain-containing protein n=1 Tax=Populus tomentosa TaxID=118781 RepID=A0A8X8A0P6_POPTO|nr:hypothetical protein POTOM_017615 [Populus tomentosa]